MSKTRKHRTLSEINTSLELARRALATAQHEVRALEAERESILRQPITVSDHALVRWWERVERLDLQVIRDRILPEEVRSQIATLGGTGKFPLPGTNCRVIVRDYTVVTVEEGA